MGREETKPSFTESKAFTHSQEGEWGGGVYLLSKAGGVNRTLAEGNGSQCREVCLEGCQDTAPTLYQGDKYRERARKER